MPDYLPLCASRQPLLPAACRSCAWWQTTGSAPRDEPTAEETRRKWMTALEPTWGSTGLLLATDAPARVLDPADAGPEDGGATGSASAPAGRAIGRTILASINYAPAASVPRFCQTPFAPLPAGAVLLFCLKSDGGHGRAPAKRLLHKALGQLRQRDLQEVYAVAIDTGGPEPDSRCEFFSLEFLEANGFARVSDDGHRYLMRADLRSLVTVLTQLQAAVRRILRTDPAPSPAAWTRRNP